METEQEMAYQKCKVERCENDATREGLCRICYTNYRTAVNAGKPFALRLSDRQLQIRASLAAKQAAKKLMNISTRPAPIPEPLPDVVEPPEPVQEIQVKEEPPAPDPVPAPLPFQPPKPAEPVCDGEPVCMVDNIPDGIEVVFLGYRVKITTAGVAIESAPKYTGQEVNEVKGIPASDFDQRRENIRKAFLKYKQQSRNRQKAG